MQGRKGKPTIKQWIASGFEDAIIRDAGCIRPGTFSVASFMALGVGYCLPTTILVSIYEGLNEISSSSHPGRGGGYFPAHFLYTWLANNFDAYELLWSTCSPYASDSKRKQSVLLDTNVSKDKGKLASKPKLKIVRSGKPSEPFVSMMEDGSSHFKIPGIDVVIPVTPIPTVPIQSITPLPQDGLPIGVCELSTEKVIELPPEGAKNIMDILDVEPNLTECMVSRAPFDGLPSLKGDFDSLYATILQRGVNVTPLESKVEGLIKQACKLDEASQRLNIEGIHYEAKTTELKQVELRREELLKEL
ncbi:hypothetical protein Cgig2_025457 [Carnegiea gigantea]|uniref:Uncharacterized protein n=1 Tax=Carnegiea gigantea TaxID=171969 RepID=A0A9Q1GRC3_9CARY|nr:hypothetical protein Cgig2_025457 [Carnegiea gigantea]